MVLRNRGSDLTKLRIPWPHDGAHTLQVEVEPDQPVYGPVEKGIRAAAGITSSHSGLRFMLEVNLGADWDVNVWETVGGVTTVRLAKRR